MTDPSPAPPARLRSRLVAFLGRYLEPPVLRFVAIAILAAGLIHLTVMIASQKGGVTIYGSNIGGDYPGFYVSGVILAKYGPGRLYDFSLQKELLHDLLPSLPAGRELPFQHPPFFALLFVPLSMLPLIGSYLCWACISVLLFLAGIRLIGNQNKRYTTLLLAASFSPFLFETVLGGNISAFGFTSICLALYFDRAGKPWSSGMALGLCLYKPTWLILVLPMLLIARRFKTLFGFSVCALILAGISLWIGGLDACLEYARLSSRVSGMTFGADNVIRTWKYVDLLSFHRILFGGLTPLAWVLIALAVLIPSPFLVRAWWRLDVLGRDSRSLVWACTLAWTSVLNVHVGIYDSIIVVAAVLLMLEVFTAGDARAPFPGALRLLLVLLYLAPWITQPLARATGIQIFTLVLAAVGAYPLIVASRRVGPGIGGGTPSPFLPMGDHERG